MKDWAGLLDRVLGTRLRHLVKSYQRAHPEAHCRVWSHTLGEATTYQGYTVGAEFQLPAGTLEIVVNLAHLDRAPGFELAEVSWVRYPGVTRVSTPGRILTAWNRNGDGAEFPVWVEDFRGCGGR